MLGVLVGTILPMIVVGGGGRRREGGWWQRFKRGAAVENGHIWDPEGETCAAHLSNGPENANIEIRLGNIAPSTHLHFWAAKESIPPYNVITHTSDAQVHESANEAYPQYDASNFNGGNVLVSEAGEAVIRIRAPSTYNMHKWGWTGAHAPHVHMRLCGDSQDGKLRADKLIFDADGVNLKGGCEKANRHNQGEPYTVLSVRNLTTGEEVLVATPTPTEAPMSESAESELTELQDWDALEFSGTFQCLVQMLLFNQVTSECTMSCPEDTEMVRGQCVRPTVSDDQVTLESKWRMQIDCDGWCWFFQKPVAVHNTRLATADHLDISIQEVKKVRLWREAETSQTHAYLTLKVKTRRLFEQEGTTLLRSLISNTTQASELFGFDVLSVELVEDDGSTSPVASGNSAGTTPAPGGATAPSSSSGAVSSTTAQAPSSIIADAAEGEDMDQYLGYYDPSLEQAAESRASKEDIAGIPVPDGVPPAAIIGGGAAVVFLVTVAGVLACIKYRKSKAAAAAAAASNAKEKEVDETVKGVIVEDFVVIGEDNEDTHNKVINNNMISVVV